MSMTGSRRGSLSHSPPRLDCPRCAGTCLLPAPCPERRCGWLCGAVRPVLVCCSLEAELWRGWPRSSGASGRASGLLVARGRAGQRDRGEMDDEDFRELMRQANDGETAVVLAAVDLDSDCWTRRALVVTWS